MGVYERACSDDDFRSGCANVIQCHRKQTVILRTTLPRTIILHMSPEFKLFTASKMSKKGTVDTYDEMLHMHNRKSWDGFAQRLLICQPEHRATKKPLLAGYVSIPAKKEKNVWSQVKPVSTRDTPHSQQRACAHVWHSPHEGIVVAIWNMSQRPSRLRRLVAGQCDFPEAGWFTSHCFYLVAGAL